LKSADHQTPRTTELHSNKRALMQRRTSPAKKDQCWFRIQRGAHKAMKKLAMAKFGPIDEVRSCYEERKMRDGERRREEDVESQLFLCTVLFKRG